jgi:hypothetical protein
MIVEDREWILGFLVGEQGDYKNRTFLQMLSFSDETLEKCHDQIQWMFPLHEESFHAITYPVLSPSIVNQARKSATIKENMKKAVKRMSDFYGFTNDDRNKQRSWCRDHDHNLLRVTRIIRSLRFFGLEDEAAEFYDKAIESADYFCLSKVTVAYWWKAMHEDVWTSLR